MSRPAIALVAGFTLSGSSSGGSPDGRRGRTAPTAEDFPAASPAGTGPAATVRVPLADPLADAPAASGGPSASGPVGPSRAASPTPSASVADDAVPPNGDLATSAPAEPAPTVTSSAPGRPGGKPGRGPGGTEGPK
ncbi:hypothetical protein [Streptomyces sp. AHA2]|uniref:hypothetical protein n=1 Tax=Streptomyces sp. AHA2 TaxID=3064526 RepID=UPI002FE0F139